MYMFDDDQMAVLTTLEATLVEVTCLVSLIHDYFPSTRCDPILKTNLPGPRAARTTQELKFRLLST